MAAPASLRAASATLIVPSPPSSETPPNETAPTPNLENDSNGTSTLENKTLGNTVVENETPPTLENGTPPTLENETPWDVRLVNTLKTLSSNAPSHNNNNRDDPVPLYTATPSATDASPSPLHQTPLQTLLTILSPETGILPPSTTPLLQLPLTAYPAAVPTYQIFTQFSYYHPALLSLSSSTTRPTLPTLISTSPDLTPDQKNALHHLQHQIITSFFSAVTTARDEAAVKGFVEHGLVSPDVPDALGRTALIAAIEGGVPSDSGMVCLLVGLGAEVGGWGVSIVPDSSSSYSSSAGTGTVRKERTALMVAAERGNLAVVRLLMEAFGAEDGVVAPDGQLALRLAAEAGHREVVAYLPARRGGAWRRWKVHHEVAVRRVKKAAGKVGWFCKVLGYHVPKLFVWEMPKHVVVKPLGKACKYCWVNKHKFGGWCKRQATELPLRAKRAGKAVWEAAKKVPRAVLDVVEKIPAAVRRLVKWLWKAIKQIPAAMKKICAWIWESLKRVGKAVGHVFLRVVAALHTAAAAVLDFFRNIKLKDVWNGVCDVFEAVFRGLPRVLWKIISSFGIVVAGIIVALFGLTGEVAVWLVKVLWYVVNYVPRQLGEMIAGIWASMAKGYHEIMVWINPKH
ncbi:ankyrin repeat domain-containing protein 50 [Chaetomidium leptoderma]|uniref:Ankyrin repeat domain-containing protein 50 n=1 Tax=Chaetomidium leptoderma TaxID=669021 RepID=A0AAN6VCH7_9PEZI|nr:ankyrin repeat domain-containing protein 50 [Chaetomidium leptoderma]